MATNSVQVIGPQDEVKTTSSKKGGGKFGTIVGGTIGGAVGAIAGTVGAPGAGTVAGGIAGAAGGAAVGGAIGEMVQPSRAGESAITRRLQSQGPQIVHSEQSEQLKQSLMAIQTQPQYIQQEYMAPLVTAYMKSVAQDNPQEGMA